MVGSVERMLGTFPFGLETTPPSIPTNLATAWKPAARSDASTPASILSVLT